MEQYGELMLNCKPNVNHSDNSDNRNNNSNSRQCGGGEHTCLNKSYEVR